MWETMLALRCDYKLFYNTLTIVYVQDVGLVNVNGNLDLRNSSTGKIFLNANHQVYIYYVMYFCSA